jgi:hypothetical protein
MEKVEPDATQPVGAEIRVNTSTFNEQRGARLAALTDGGFVVVWTDESEGNFVDANDDGEDDFPEVGGDGADLAVKAQVFTTDGAPGRR